MNTNELPTPDNRRLVSSDLLASVERHVCRWAFIYVLISYAAFVLCDQLWLNWRWANGDTVYDVAMCAIGFFWLGIIGLSKLLLSLANNSGQTQPPKKTNQLKHANLDSRKSKRARQRDG